MSWGLDKVFVSVREATGIKSTNLLSNDADTYLVIKLKAYCENGLQVTIRNTLVRAKSLSPEWNESFEFSLSEHPEYDVMFFTLVAKSTLGSDKILGRVEIPVALLACQPNADMDTWFKLLPEKKPSW